MKQMTAEDLDSDSCGYSISWIKDITKEEQVFIMGVTAVALDSDTSFDATTAKMLLKKFRKKKQLLKSNKANRLQAAPRRLISDICIETIDNARRGIMLKGVTGLWIMHY